MILIFFKTYVVNRVCSNFEREMDDGNGWFDSWQMHVLYPERLKKSEFATKYLDNYFDSWNL